MATVERDAGSAATGAVTITGAARVYTAAVAAVGNIVTIWQLIYGGFPASTDSSVDADYEGTVE